MAVKVGNLLYRLYFYGIATTSNILSQPIEYIQGVTALKGDLLRKELQIFNWYDLLHHFPLRHLDRTKVDQISTLNLQHDYAYVKGRVIEISLLGTGRAKRLVVYAKDDTGIIELVWFQGINWVEKRINIGDTFLFFGKLSFFMGKPQISHPELEVFKIDHIATKTFLEPIYPSTEKLKAKELHGRAIGKLTQFLFTKVGKEELPENLPNYLLEKYRLVGRFEAYKNMHFPQTEAQYQAATRRLKFEELFFAQLRMCLIKIARHKQSRGFIFDKVGDYFNTFYSKFLPFALTGAQKRVIKEVHKDTASGRHMNRLLQGDVGSGKTIVALLTMLIAADNGYQSVLMAPTEILAQQHFKGISDLLKDMPVEVHLLTGSTKAKNRRLALEAAQSGDAKILIGTHALIEDKVQFKNLGFAVIDEQHKFGVAQRSKLWAKNSLAPHVLVMTATPIPRTLALTAYGDLDYSVIDELPPGRQPIKTTHRNEAHRSEVMTFVKNEIVKGRQAYFIYPLIEESTKLEYENLMKGYEEVKSFFPEPRYWISMLHGKQPPELKETNMHRFVTNDTQIMVATTVIEVGVNVPNASVMVIESAEKFGLSQLHQLRGRVGRGAEQSFCVLLSGPKISKVGQERLKIMEATNDGFKIAEKDLELRGPGDIEGTRQSGALDYKVANLITDKPILEVASKEVDLVLQNDFELTLPENQPIKNYLQQYKGKTLWSKIS
jgi:ATP-dependent DNA helicase RecG